MTGPLHRVGAVVLTYNSTEDLPACLDGLKGQTEVDLWVIVVDNDSRPDARAQMEADFMAVHPDGCIFEAAQIKPEDLWGHRAVFVRNKVNRGYSAGNNIGARIAAAFGCDAILILNPDVRIPSSIYAKRLSELINSGEKTAVACSNVINLNGKNENPMKEPSYLHEALWPISIIASKFIPKRIESNNLSQSPFEVEKVSGACFLIQTSFLQYIGYFDERVFLYCEEAILMAQVRASGWSMLMEPGLTAIHAHRTESKNDPLRRYRIWSASRAYFHEAYSNYGAVRTKVLSATRCVGISIFYIYHLVRRRFH